MSGVKGLLSRVAKLEAARAGTRSPFVRHFGSFEAFEDQTRAEVDAGKLDRIDMLGANGDGGVLGCLRRWERDGTWGGWRQQINGVSEFTRG